MQGRCEKSLRGFDNGSIMKETPDQYASFSVNVETPAEEAAEQLVESRGAARRYAVLVCHGMGQQVKFETHGLACSGGPCATAFFGQREISK